MFKEIKERLKNYAKEIRDLKSKRKLINRGKLNLAEIEVKIVQLKYHFRHIHIALCEVRGRTREQIEKPSKFNPADQRYIDKIKTEILQKIEDEKIIRASAQGS